MPRRNRKYFRKRFDVSDLVRYDLKIMDYGAGERYILKKYIKQQDGRWSGSAGSKITIDALSDEEVPQMMEFMSEHIMNLRKEQDGKDAKCKCGGKETCTCVDNCEECSDEVSE